MGKKLSNEEEAIEPLGPWVWLPAKSAHTPYRVWGSQEFIPNLADYDSIIVILPDSPGSDVVRDLKQFEMQIPIILAAGRTIVWIMSQNKKIIYFGVNLTQEPLDIIQFLQ